MSEADYLGEEEEDLEGEPEIDSSVPPNLIHLEHSFGYDCKRVFNLCLIDDDTLVFASGNYLHYFSISNRTVTFRESRFGGGIGFITKNEHPDYQGLLTVGENGPRPTVFIYEFPSHDVRIKLEGAAKAMFTTGSYNSTGDLFASQAGRPDFMLTIWRWQTAEIILRAKSYQNNVMHVHFSRFNPILLVSSGLSHIKFWKMANTFTGLKLQGELGRFGKTDFSDIYAIYMLSDENVICGSDWGNMLLWEAGLIKFEICRKGRKPCHTKPITRITMENGEVTTVGMDGYVRIWFWETVDLADPPEDDRFVEIEPIYEFKIGDSEIRAIQKIKPFDAKDYGYYVQDGNGGIWYCDLNTDNVPNEPRKLYSCHGGKIIAGQASPVSNHFITLGEDGKIFIYDYIQKRAVLEKQFTSIGTDLLWFNTYISKSGMELVAGFEDGILRQLLLNLESNDNPKLHLVSAIKGHVAAITKISVNPTNTVMITGAADRTIFLYEITEKIRGLVDIKPICYIKFDGIPGCFYWLEAKNPTVLIGCKGGEVYEYILPKRITDEQTYLSYNMTEKAVVKSTKFVSVKSVIRREIKREKTKMRKEAKRQRKLLEIEKLKKANPGLQIDMETALADSEPEEEEEPLYYPPQPNPIFWLKYTAVDTIWVSMGAYDAGYIYELKFEAKEPVRSTIIADGDDIEVRSYLLIEEYLIFGLANGKLRINRTYVEDFTDLSDYRLFSMHDPLNGIITQIFADREGVRLFSIGYDGNVFLYKWNGPAVHETLPIAEPVAKEIKVVDDIDDPEYPSLEQEKINAELRRQQEAAEAHARKVLAQIAVLQVKFDDIYSLNVELHEDIRIPHSQLLLDDRITTQIADELQAELDDVRDDLAYDLEVAQVGKTKLYDYFFKDLDHMPIKLKGIGNNIVVASIRQDGFTEAFMRVKEAVEERLRLEAAKHRIIDHGPLDAKEAGMPKPGIENFFFGRDPKSILPRFSRKMLRLLRSYRKRKLYDIERTYKWEKMEQQKPDPNKNDPEDERKIREAQRAMGDYKLKIGYDYVPKPDENLTHKYAEVVECRERCFKMINDFNDELFNLRDQKEILFKHIESTIRRLHILHKFIPANSRKRLPNIPAYDLNDEYPDLNLIEHFTPGCGIEIDDILYLEKNVQSLLPKVVEVVPTAVITNEEKIELIKYDMLSVDEVKAFPKDEELDILLENLPIISDPTYIESVDDKPAPWLIDTRLRWLCELIDEQKFLISDVKACIKKYNILLIDTYYKRCAKELELEFMLCFMITLNQELYVMRDSEEIENKLLANATNAMLARNRAMAIINATKRHIEEARKAGEKLNDSIASIQLQFLNMCKGNKFYDFLRRIFKKKWKPKKPPRGEDDTSESSSDSDDDSSDDNDDTKSIDSMDITTIQLDEDVCPSGLEKHVYDLAFKMRSDRHALERSLLLKQRKVVRLRIATVDSEKKMEHEEEVFTLQKKKLINFRRRRQRELNKVKVAIFLHLNQIQHFEKDNEYRKLRKAVLFDSKRLDKLKERVDELKIETLETKRIYRVNIVHLRRMNNDIKFMKFEITKLEASIKDEMTKKFGMVVNLDELQEEVLRKYIFELETTAEDELRAIDREIKKKLWELAQLENELIAETKLNSERLNIYTVLQEEKNILDEIIAVQDKRENEIKVPKVTAWNLDRDIANLLAIDSQQKEQIECLEREICTMRLKSKPLQIDQEPKQIVLAPTDDLTVCPEMLGLESYHLRMLPDDFIMERVGKIVLKFMNQRFTGKMSTDNMRKYSNKLSLYFAQAAYTFEGKLTARILECITESLQGLMPKKYLLHITSDDMNKLFEEILTVFDYERSDVNTEDVISGIYANAKESLAEADEWMTSTQVVMEHMFKELIEVLPLEEFQSENTLRIIVNILDKEEIINPTFLSIEHLIERVVKYAQENLLDDITAVPIRRLANNICKELIKRKPKLPSKCSHGSVADVSISSKKKSI